MADEQVEILVSFPDISKADANRAAEELRDALLEKVPDGLTAELRRSDERAQGADTLVLLFGTGAAVAIAQGLRALMGKLGTRVELKTPSGTVVATGDAAARMDVAQVAAALGKYRR